MAARAAQRHLYELAESPDWQSHRDDSLRHFVNPFEDHATIVRLERARWTAEAALSRQEHTGPT